MRTAISMMDIKTLAAYRAKHAKLCHHVVSRPLLDDTTIVYAYVNHGRWLANCPVCNGGIPVHPTWNEGGCADCGTWFARIEVPVNWSQIEEILSVRKPANQNWDTGETIERLRSENIRFADQLRRGR